MSNHRPTLVVRRQHAPVQGWVIVAQHGCGSERQLVGVFASKAAAERWINANPAIELDTKSDH